MSATPRVSILIPVYNRADLIGQTLASALGQSFAELEVVVVDNCSTDDSWEVIQAVAAGDPRVRAFRNDSNIGPVRNWLRCLREACGIYGKILWSDDLMHADFLAQAVPLLEDPGVGFVYSPARIFAGDDPQQGSVLYASTPVGARPASEFIEGTLLLRDYPVSPGCALFRLADMRECLLEQVPNRVGSDFAMHAIGNDVLLFLLVAARYPHFVRLDAAMSYFREHAGSITISSNPGKITLSYAIAKAYFVEACPPPNALVARFNALLLLFLLRFRSNALGLRRVDDFYPHPGPRPLSYAYLAGRFALAVVSRLRRSIAS